MNRHTVIGKVYNLKGNVLICQLSKLRCLLQSFFLL